MSKYRNRSKIKYLVIHCSATPNGVNFTATDIDRWHKDRKFKRATSFPGPLRHIGYHSVISLTGRVSLGRQLNETGAHARGFNTSSIGCCLIGTDKFTKQQWLSLRAYVDEMVFLFPQIRVIGHNDLTNKKSCPCFNVKKWLKTGRTPKGKQL